MKEIEAIASKQSECGMHLDIRHASGVAALPGNDSQPGEAVNPIPPGWSDAVKDIYANGKQENKKSCRKVLAKCSAAVIAGLNAAVAKGTAEERKKKKSEVGRHAAA